MDASKKNLHLENADKYLEQLVKVEILDADSPNG